MFVLVWTVGYIIAGVPHFDRINDAAGEMERENCEARAIVFRERMHDWARGNLVGRGLIDDADLSFPIGVYGECRPVKQDS